MALDAIVVGGGLAGMSAATALTDAGARVLLIEQRRLLGGRAGSFLSPNFSRRMLDNSQHVLLGCCDELQAFYARLGVSHLIQFQDELVFADTKGRRGVMKASCLPAPLHLGPSMMGFGVIPFGHRIEIMQAMLRMQAIGRDGRNQFADVSFERVLLEMGQSAGVIAGFWDVICVSALNEPCATAAGHYGLQVFQEAFLGSRGGFRLGFARVPLSMLYRQLPAEALLNTSVKSLIVESGRVCGVRLADREIRAGRIILAVSPWSAVGLLTAAKGEGARSGVGDLCRPFRAQGGCGLIPGAMPQANESRPVGAEESGPPNASRTAELLDADPQLARLEHLQYRPIVGAHLQFDRAVLDVPNLALMGTRLHWAFADSDDPTLIHGVASAADDLCPLPQQTITDLFVDELRQTCPAARAATLRQFVIIKEARATFRPLPGVDAFRPTQQTLIPGLTLAGDYTQTTWPSTMEGAVRSGRLAAQAALR